ncbi:MAG: chromo domain-containing protein, partial [Candidatus Thiodiazotropha sp.]
RLTRYMTHKQTHKWVDVLGEITRSYNNTYHRSIKQTPGSIKDKDEEFQWSLQYDTLPEKPRDKTTYARYKFKIGDEVRVSFLRKNFQKQHDERWSRETYTVINRSMNNGIPQYTLRDYSGTDIKGKFYQNQLLKAFPSETFLIERVISRRRRGGLEEVLVKWKGWDKQYNTWLKATDLEDYKP